MTNLITKNWTWLERTPEPLMDWDELRRVKGSYCYKCLEFDQLIGACKLKKLPTIDCEVYNKVSKLKG